MDVHGRPGRQASARRCRFDVRSRRVDRPASRGRPAARRRCPASGSSLSSTTASRPSASCRRPGRRAPAPGRSGARAPDSHLRCDGRGAGRWNRTARAPRSAGSTAIEALRPSRYCPSDRLVGFARSHFGAMDSGDRVRTICALRATPHRVRGGYERAHDGRDRHPALRPGRLPRLRAPRHRTVPRRRRAGPVRRRLRARSVADGPARGRRDRDSTDAGRSGTRPASPRARRSCASSPGGTRPTSRSPPSCQATRSSPDLHVSARTPATTLPYDDHEHLAALR